MENKTLKLIVTIIATFLVSFVGIYTLYNVFLAKGPENNSNDKKVEEVSTATIAEELLKKVPYLIHTSSAYRLDETRFTSLDYSVVNNVILNYLKNKNDIIFDYNIPSFITFKENNCLDGTNKKCYIVSQEQMDSTAKLLYGESAKINFEEFTIYNNNENKCIVDLNNYFCVEDEIIDSKYSGKISTIEGIKVDNEYMYIYEKAIFVVNAQVNQDSNIYNIEIDALLQTTNDDSKIAEKITLISLTEDYTASLMTKYSGDIKLYKSTFKKVGENQYFWMGTKMVKHTAE